MTSKKDLGNFVNCILIDGNRRTTVMTREDAYVDVRDKKPDKYTDDYPHEFPLLDSNPFELLKIQVGGALRIAEEAAKKGESYTIIIRYNHPDPSSFKE